MKFTQQSQSMTASTKPKAKDKIDEVKADWEFAAKTAADPKFKQESKQAKKV